jgi:hypothetical protein
MKNSTQEESLQAFDIKPPKMWYMHYYFMRGLARFIYLFPWVGKLFNFLGSHLIFIANLGKREKVQEFLIAQLSNASQNKPQEFGSGFGYDDFMKEVFTAYKYHMQISKVGFDKLKSESHVLYQKIIDFTSDIIKKDENIKDFLNFGVSYGYIDNVLAQKYRHVNFYGLDRSVYTKFYNEENIPKVPNLHFVASDVFQFMRQGSFNNGIFFHARTMCLMPKEFIKSLYDEANKAGFRYIVGFEFCGISRQTNRPYIFSDADKPSVLFRDFMLIHNYPGLLKSSGFKLENMELLKTNHRDKDLRVLCFVAKIIR